MTSYIVTYWREMALKNFFQYAYDTGINSEEYYLAEAKRRYREAKATLCQATPDEDVSDHEDEIFRMAVIFLCYGRLDFLPDVLTYDPGYGVDYVIFKKSAWFIVPFPSVIRGNTEKALVWYEENKQNIFWSPQENKYVLKET